MRGCAASVKKNILLLLIICILTASLSCAQADDTGSVTENTGTATEAETEDLLKDNLPDIRFDGSVFKMFVQTLALNYYFIEQLTGEIIDDAVYTRNMTVEDRFDAAIETVDADGGWDARIKFMNSIRNSIAAGDNDYDVVAPEYYYGAELVLEGLYLDLYKLEHLDFSRPWWTAGFNEQAELYGKLFAGVGSLALSQIDGVNILYFNKELAANYNAGDLYGMVKDGTWTYDRFFAIAESAHSDLDGDGKFTAADQFGYTLQLHGPRSFVTNFKLDYINIDAEGNPQIVFYSERMLDAFDKIYRLVNATDSVYYNTDAVNIIPVFRESRALFMTLTLGYVQQLRDMEVDFGLLPMPKYDDGQAEYRATPVGTDLYSIPSTAVDTDFVSIMLEALNAETYRNVYPKYYDIALKTKSSRDEESGEMLDLIFESLYYDFGFINGSNISYIADYFGNNIVNKVQDYASFWAKNEAQYQRDLDDLVAVYREME